MATKKKTNISKKQSVSSARPRSYSELYKADKTGAPQVYNAPTKKAAATQEIAAPAQSLNWRAEYAHVIRDVRTLLIVSAVLFAIIIITGFFV
jgi:hypothetical protein